VVKANSYSLQAKFVPPDSAMAGGGPQGPLKNEQVEQANQLWRESIVDSDGNQEHEWEAELVQETGSRSRKNSRVHFSPDTIKVKLQRF
jgi:hypothetical protein